MSAKPGIMELLVEAKTAEGEGESEFAALLQKPRSKPVEVGPVADYGFDLETLVRENQRLAVEEMASRRADGMTATQYYDQQRYERQRDRLYGRGPRRICPECNDPRCRLYQVIGRH